LGKVAVKELLGSNSDWLYLIGMALADLKKRVKKSIKLITIITRKSII
jgi:hypothetical protein